MSSSKAVNVPTDQKVKEKDINAKLQLYGIYSGESPHFTLFSSPFPVH
jgi:hypothetical protein